MWGLFQVNAQQAWNVSTGSSAIVVATTDNDIEIAHPDLANVLWVNSGEIPGNGIDDDGNGYVDDINGFDGEHEAEMEKIVKTINVRAFMELASAVFNKIKELEGIA